jgi:hypothetical protein
MFEEFSPGLGHPHPDLFVELLTKLLERRFDFLRRSALLVDVQHSSLEVDAGVDSGEDVVRGPKHAAEEAELLFQEFVSAAVDLVLLVEEVDDDHIVFLTVAVATPDSLLDALGVPREVVVDQRVCPLEVDVLTGASVAAST